MAAPPFRLLLASFRDRSVPGWLGAFRIPRYTLRNEREPNGRRTHPPHLVLQSGRRTPPELGRYLPGGLGDTVRDGAGGASRALHRDGVDRREHGPASAPACRGHRRLDIRQPGRSASGGATTLRIACRTRRDPPGI